MRALETVAGLERFERRGAGTNSERRAARWLADELSRAGREVVIEPFWCRPDWALAHLWHVGLALAGSLVSVPSPRAGAIMLIVALVSILADAFTGVSAGRRLTPERASQNVVALPAPTAQRAPDAVRLLITANYDAGRVGVAYRERLRRITSALRRASFGLTPGWLGWLTLTVVALTVLAILRVEGHRSETIGAIQLLPTIVLVLAVALLLELATADPGPAAGDNGSGTAVAIELARALDAAPPRQLVPEVVLQGAGDGGGIGLRHHLRGRRKQLTAANTIVIGIAAVGGGTIRWWTSDGPLLPLRYSRELAAHCRKLAGLDPDLAAGPHPGRGAGPAFQARLLRRESISIGCLDAGGIVPRSHQRNDTADALDQEAIDSAVQFGLMLVDEIDAWLAVNRPRRAVTPA